MSADGLGLDAIRVRAEAATPGPWFVEHVGEVNDKGAAISCVRWRGYVNNAMFDEDFATADFIAAARTDVPALVAEVERLRVENASLTEAAEVAVESGNLALASGQRAVADGNTLLDIIAKKDAVLGAVAALVDECEWITRDRSLVQRGYVRVDDLRAVLAPVSGAVAEPGREDVETRLADVFGDILDDHRPMSMPDEDEVQCKCDGTVWERPDWRRHVGQALIDEAKADGSFPHLVTPVAKHEQEVRAAEAWDLAVEEAFHCGHLHDVALTEMRERNPYRADALTGGPTS